MKINVNDWVLWGSNKHPRVGLALPRGEAYKRVGLRCIDTFDLWRYVISHDHDLRLFMPAAARAYFEQFVGDEDESA